ncbi:MAG: hypothetical protein WCD36_14110 [Rhodanobacteraceae bacterium]
MNKFLISTGVLLASLALASCSDDTQSSAPASASTAAATPAGVDHPMEPSTSPPPETPAPASAATVAGYEIPPFPLSNVGICDRYASEARRCLNEVATDDKRRAYERDINSLLKKVTPKPGEPVNEWLTSDCRRGLGLLAQRYPQCAIQK